MRDIDEWMVAELLTGMDGEYDDNHDVFISIRIKDGTDVEITLSRTNEDNGELYEHHFRIDILEM